MRHRLARGALSAACLMLVLNTNARAETADTAAFLNACVADPVILDGPSLGEGSEVTPKIYCDCIAGKLVEGAHSQADVDMLTKMHKDDITDEDAEAYPTLDVLMEANEAIEEECRADLGLPVSDDEEEGEAPLGEVDIPVEE